MLHCSMTANTGHNSAIALSASADQDVEPRSEPPLVYREPDTQDHWIVEPPHGATRAEDTKVFTGSCAQLVALTYAHEKFGGARFFPY